MDRLQRNLDGYLEEKRELFPRFYFISSDELLQILATATDLKSVEKHVNKCFENINAFILQDESEREAPRSPDRVREGAHKK
jgi:dynein heavy chain, axonemal